MTELCAQKLIDPSKRHLGILYASITAILWGFLAILLKITVAFLSPHTIVWFRFLIAFTVLFIFFSIQNPGYLKIIRKPPIILLIAAFCLGLNYIGFMLGIHFTSPGNTQIIIQLGPILLAITGVVIYKESLSLKQLVGFGVAGVGFLIFYSNQFGNLLKDKGTFNTGVLYTVLGAICWVIYASIQKKLVQKWPAQQLNLIIYGIPVIMFFPFVEFSGFEDLKIWQWGLLIFLGINTLIAYGSLTASFKYIEANKVSIIITLNPIITFILMAILETANINWIKPEVISFYGILGGILVLSGAVLAVIKSSKKSSI